MQLPTIPISTCKGFFGTTSANGGGGGVGGGEHRVGRVHSNQIAGLSHMTLSHACSSSYKCTY